jgi:hypothetical protein
MSGTRLDATAEPGADAKLTVVSILCGTKVFVPAGTCVELSGGDILGSHRVTAQPSVDGPVMKIQAIPVLGRITICTADTEQTRARRQARPPPTPTTRSRSSA